MLVQVPEDECSLVIADSYAGRLMAAIAKATDAPPMASTATAGLPTPATTAASMVDLKGLARPEKFDGTDEHWLEWKFTFKTVMSLLDIT
eukprot:14861264-Heterocapsa_arctica.AAC.1